MKYSITIWHIWRAISGCLLTAVLGCAAAQQTASPDIPKATAGTVTDMPIDTLVTVGELPNGLKYFIRENRKPESRAELRLVVNAGSLMEDDDQQGLAHFVEHMAFNGTQNFPKQSLVNYLESIGLRFGPDLNAQTSFDETVYILQVPTDSVRIVEQAFEIMEDWASRVSFQSEEIEKERGVIIEEWRSRLGAGARIYKQQIPAIYHKSRYADRMPIGVKAVLDTFRHERIKDFYRSWYRPDLMAVIAVGDFEAARIEELIQTHFGRVPEAESPRPRPVYTVPDHEETLFSIVSDPEASWSSVNIYFKKDARAQGNVEAYRQSLVESLHTRMLNERFRELSKIPDAPFLSGRSGRALLARSKEVYSLSARVKEGGVLPGLQALIIEAGRLKQHGFTDTELAREKVEMLRSIEQAYREKDKVRSGAYASEYIRHYLTGEPIPGLPFEYDLYNKLIPGIAIEEINGLTDAWMTDHNRVILVDGPEKPGVTLPDSTELLAMIDEVETFQFDPYIDESSDLPLMESLPKPGTVVEERAIAELGVYEWTLGNGVKVVLKPTDFENDQVIFTAFSPGGHSLVSDEDYLAASTATHVLRESGVGNFSLLEIRKKLSGKLVSISPWIGEIHEGMSGSASARDVETLFKMIHLAFTKPRTDSTAFVAFKEKLRGLMENRSVSPGAAYEDTIQVTLSQNHHRARIWTLEMLEEMDLMKSFQIYKDRFADASDFTFIFVGNFDVDAFRSLVQVYLGSLPSLGRQETWRDVGLRAPSGVIEKTVRRGLEAKSSHRLVFSGPLEWSRQAEYDLNAMTQVLSIKLREVVREALGGSYGVGVWGAADRFPRARYSVTLDFECSPDRVEELTGVVFSQIDSLKRFGTTEAYLQKVKESQRRSREVALKENRFWGRALQNRYVNGEDPKLILSFDQKVDGLDLASVQKAANAYLDTSNYARFVLLPELKE
jgi:zinc protease